MGDFFTIKPNEHESKTITGLDDPAQALLQLKEMSPAVPIVTLAERGSMLIEKNEIRIMDPDHGDIKLDWSHDSEYEVNAARKAFDEAKKKV